MSRVLVAVLFADGTGKLLSRDEYLELDQAEHPVKCCKLVNLDEEAERQRGQL